MAMSYKDLRELVLRGPSSGRYTQDSPILPDVWIQFARDLDTGKSNLLKQVDLLLTPRRDVPPADLLTSIQAALDVYRESAKGKEWSGSGKREDPELSVNRAYVVGQFYFDEVVCVLLPLTKWWNEYVWRMVKGKSKKTKGKGAASNSDRASMTPGDLRTKDGKERVLAALGKGAEERLDKAGGVRIDSRIDDLVWLVRVVGTLEHERQRELGTTSKKARSTKADDAGADGIALPPEEQLTAFSELLAKVPVAKVKKAADKVLLAESPEREAPACPLWSVALNRKIKLSVWRSVEATKADAARRLFNIRCDKIRWAVIDSGIDATHPAFRKRKGTSNGPWAERSRILETYDFTRLRGETRDAFTWEELRPKLRILHDKKYDVPTSRHGTHVAGIIAMDWCQDDDPAPPDEYDLKGVCPDIELFDMRVLGPNGGSEFDILGALQFIRWLNANKDEPIIHGVNISISLPHDKANYACGRTPICEECERLTASGVVVVAAAGNEGWAHYDTEMGRRDGFRTVCITDPGNADAVITVGATHRFKPHTYGVSYFSSRGPTGDGRIKPDLVAPGEKIKSAAPDGEVDTLDGTSMAAPHVSGAAALLMARHNELVGQPYRIKEILCKTATDLGRERYFQGAGMLDVLRALQSV